MTIAHLINFKPDERRSLGRFLLRLAEEVHARGGRLIFVFGGEPSDWYQRELHRLNSAYITATFPVAAASVGAISQFLKENEAGVMMTAFMSPFNYWLVQVKKRAALKSWIVVDRSSGEARTGSVIGMVKRGIALYFFESIDLVLCISDFVKKRDIEKNYFPSRKVQVVHNGVDIRVFQKDTDAPRKAGVTLVYAGQLIPEKGVDVFLAAVSRVAFEGELSVRIAGAGPAQQELRALAERLLPGKVEFLGHVWEIAPFFQAADIAVFPSRWAEAFGFVVAEAMACGVPVVGSRVGAIPEVIGDDEQAGLLFERDNVPELAQKLELLVHDKARRTQMGHRARQRVESRFSLEQMIAGYLELLEQVGLSKPVPHVGEMGKAA